jgi:hypothetical protein
MPQTYFTQHSKDVIIFIMDIPKLNEVDRFRAAKAIERLMPELDMAPPYDEFATTALGRFMTVSRDFDFSEAMMLASQQGIDLLSVCFSVTRAEMGLPNTDIDKDASLSGLEFNLSMLAGILIVEGIRQE